MRFRAYPNTIPVASASAPSVSGYLGGVGRASGYAPSTPRKPLSAREPVLSRAQSWLLNIAAFAYAVSMHKFAFRDFLASNVGIQGFIEAAGICGAFLCVLIATWKLKRDRLSLTPVAFAIFGLFAIASSVRSYDPRLSAVKGMLLLVVLATGSVIIQAGLGRRYFRSLYYSYCSLLVIGIIVGIIFRDRYPLVSVIEYSGRTRVSVFDTFPGVMGEECLLLLLVAPLTGARIGLVSQFFLVVMNLLAAGKTHSALLILVLIARFIYAARKWPALKSLAVCFGIASIVTLSAGAVSLVDPGRVSRLIDRGTKSIYGSGVTEDISTLDGRLDLWEESVKLLRSGALIGYGFDGARDAMIKVAEWSGSSHNGYLEIALAGGLTGSAIFFVGVVLVVKASFLAPPEKRRHALALVLVILTTDFIGPTFSAQSYFGILIFLWLSSETRWVRGMAVKASRELLPRYRAFYGGVYAPG